MMVVNLYQKIILLLVCCTIFLSSCWSSDEAGSYEPVSAGQPTLAPEEPVIEEGKVEQQLEAVEEEVVLSSLASEAKELVPRRNNVIEPEEVRRLDLQLSLAVKSVDENLTGEAVRRKGEIDRISELSAADAWSRRTFVPLSDPLAAGLSMETTSDITTDEGLPKRSAVDDYIGHSSRVKTTPRGGGGTWGRFDGTVTEEILESLDAERAIPESTLVDREIMAIEEINAAGGVIVDGKNYKIEYIKEDAASDWPTFAEKSKKLIDQDGVPVVFGGWTFASRKAMLPVYESKDAFLYYPIQYEAQECSNNIFYTGVTPDQQIEPAIDFMYKHSPAAGGNVFLIGSDDVFPRILNTITNAQVKQLGGTVVGEGYLPLGNTEVAPIILKIKKALPEGGIIINTLNGDQNVAFFKQIQEAGITPSSGYYAMNYSIAQEEISTIGPKYLEGHYGVWNYTTSIDTPKNDGFSRVGQPISPEEISTIGPEFIEDELAISDEGFPATATRQLRAGGTGSAQNVLAEVIPNHHLSQTVIIGEINAEGGITILKKTEVVLPQALDPELERLTRFSCAQTDGGQETEGWLGVSGLLFPKIVPDGREFLQPERMEPSIADTTPSNQLGVGLSYKEACAYNGRVEIISSTLATASDPMPIEEKVRICSTVNQLEIYCVLEGEKKRKLKDYTEELQKTIAELGVELKTRNKVSVTFDIDENGILEVTSQNKSLGEKINVKAKCDETIEVIEERDGLLDETTLHIEDEE